ncbi:MAG: DUF4139 domain-containing protein [bacterium]|nr:DUF4139 domain-containing protein [bacterium]
MKKFAGFLTLVLFLPTLLIGAETLKSTLNDQKTVAITIYNSNLALVKDIREILLPAGISELRFMDVAQNINPATVYIKSLNQPEKLGILEQNYEYDLLNPQKLMEKYIDKNVKVVDKNYYTGEETIYDAKVLSTNGGPIFEVEGRIMVGLPHRIIYPTIPENLIAKPTLVWLLDNRYNKKHTVEASYLTGGINWKADYVAVLDKDDKKVDLNGWVTINNNSGAEYRDALIKLVAGDINRVYDEGGFKRMDKLMLAEARSVSDFTEEALFEYHLYTLQRPATIKQNQTKQISLLQSTDIPVKKELIYWGSEYYYRGQYGQPISNQKVGAYINIENKKENHLGVPLPKGTVRVYKADREGSLQFIGEDSIDHTPKDEKIKIKLGDSFDVIGERKQLDWKSYGVLRNIYESEWEISLRNHKDEYAEVRVIEPVPGDWEVLNATHKWEKTEAHTLEFNVKVPKNEEVKIKYRIKTHY